MRRVAYLKSGQSAWVVTSRLFEGLLLRFADGREVWTAERDVLYVE
jgi:hypothetical protein